jgi:DNA mismatch repair protein MutL
MRRPIRALPPHIASLIAAGEVIKQPVDVIRELIDNSIDAEADKIDISIEQGGLQSIQIRDNGVGIPCEEIPLALMRHATSKIRRIEDIEQIQTLGFRGEALASISAVARVKLTSRVEGTLHGWEVTVEPGQSVDTPKPVAHPIGTTITVTELFHHIPARRRFLRTATTEFTRIHHWIKCFSVSHSNIAFSLAHNKRSILECPILEDVTHPQLSRLAVLTHASFPESAILVNQQGTHFSLLGWISPPDFSRSQPDWQYFYVNRRLIKDKTLSHAVKQAYHDVLYRDRHPVVILSLEIASTEVDINVHPTKAEVRFHQPHLVHDFVYKTIQRALAQQKGTASTIRLTDNPMRFSNEKETRQMVTSRSLQERFLPNKTLAAPLLDEHLTMPNQVPSNPTLSQDEIASSERKKSSTATLKQPQPTHQPLGYALAQLHNIYILAQNDKGLVIIDAHAAHERVLYEQLKQALDQKRPRQQLLLVPCVLSLTESETALIEAYAPLFHRLGFTYTKSGQETFTLTAIPDTLPAHIPLDRLIHDILSDLQEHGLTRRVEEESNRLLAKLACRSATHANRTMSLYEMNNLLRTIETTPFSSQCNHGRPTWRQIELSELDSWFLRGR